MGALSGLRVLDLSRVLAGPYCTQMLGDMGADIIKIEKPFAGDDTRFWGPPFHKDPQGHDTKESAYYLSINRNKKSVAVDIAKPEGQEIILGLLAHCDILIENFKTGNLAKYNLDYDQIQQKFPRLIYCSITGFGASGPLALEPGYDLVAQAMGGLMATTGEVDGAPMKSGIAVSDILTGLHAAIGILSALNHRNQTGMGQRVDVNLLDCTLATMTNLAQFYLTSGKVAKRQGNAHSTIVPYQAFRTVDSWCVIAVGNDHQFQKLCALLGENNLAQDPKFATNSARLENRNELVAILEKYIVHFTTADLVSKCREQDIPAGPVNRLDQTFAEPQAQHNGMAIDMGDMKLVGSPLKFTATPVDYQLTPPTLGRDTRDVLQDILKMPDTMITDLVTKKVIQLG
jgi:crotonobetainyl-CoA:carnitine CoA-transferase CaiB-like acyl-CoA transferase